VRDFLYDRVARDRYRLFGRTESCLVPSPDVARRFLSGEDEA
jgi:predicted DCC family thiol-disulfide oxidoreductase YuxK